MTLTAGQSDLGETLVLAVAGQEITGWDHVSLHSSFQVPTDQLTFTLTDLSQRSLLVHGAPMTLTLNGRPQFSGFLDKTRAAVTRGGGTVLTSSGRDMLGPVINSNVSPKKRLPEGSSLLDLVASVLVPLRITTVYNDGSLNVNLQTGAAQKPKLSSSALNIQLPSATLGSDQTLTQSFSTVSLTSQVSAARPDLQPLKMNQLKPHPGEGAYQYLDRMLKRFGLRMWAAADGSGVIIDHANFSQAPVQTLDGTQVESAELTIDWEAQPSCIIAEGLGAMDAALDRRPMTVVMVNELTGTDPQGNILPDIQTIISTFPGVTVLPLRPQLFPARADFYASQVTRPMFVKDDQARTVDQLSYFVRREMANRQNKAFHLRYTVPGATYQGKPWAINSIVQVSDPNLELDLPLWVMEREFECSRDGSRTHLTLIRPYTLALDAP